MKNPTHHICLTGHSLAAKNSLEKAIVAYLKTLNGKLITSVKLKKLTEEIILHIDNLNKHFNRCKPFNVSFWRDSSDTNFHLSGFYTISFKIFDAYLDHEK